MDKLYKKNLKPEKTFEQWAKENEVVLTNKTDLGKQKGENKQIESRCGILCSECGYKEQVGCKGCVNIDKPFHGDCPVKSCCEGKGEEHCGGCLDFACKQLTEYAYDKEHGDNGKRIEQCKKWNRNR